MGIARFLQDSLNIIWVVLGLAALILVVGWLLSRLIAKWAVGLLNRTTLIQLIVQRLNLSSPDVINHRLRQAIRALIILVSFWGAWKTLNSHPAIAEFLTQTGQAIQNFVHRPVVIFLFDLVLIGLATYFLFKAFGWVKSGFQNLANRIEAERGKSLKDLKSSAFRCSQPAS